MSVKSEKSRRGISKVMLTAFLAVTVIASATLLAGCGADGSTTTKPDSTSGTAAPPTVSADTAPDFTGVTLDGLDVSLSEYRGKPLVLAFMASW